MEQWVDCNEIFFGESEALDSMTPQILASLPAGTIVKMDDGEEGEIIQAGTTIHIMWPDSDLTSIWDLNSKVWAKLVTCLEVA